MIATLCEVQRDLCNARGAEDVSFHSEGHCELASLPLPMVSALLQAMLWQPPDIALYDALKPESPLLARRICERDAGSVPGVVLHHDIYHPH